MTLTGTGLTHVTQTGDSSTTSSRRNFFGTPNWGRYEAAIWELERREGEYLGPAVSARPGVKNLKSSYSSLDSSRDKPYTGRGDKLLVRLNNTSDSRFNTGYNTG